jgi:hypothetical protein
MNAPPSANRFSKGGVAPAKHPLGLPMIGKILKCSPFLPIEKLPHVSLDAEPPIAAIPTKKNSNPPGTG